MLKIQWAIITFAAVIAFAGTAYGESDNNCSASWERYSSDPYLQLAFPDTGANYWRFRFEVGTQDDIGLRITGKYTYSRYMNFNIYDQETIDSSGSLPDRSIIPDPGSLNPFLLGEQRDTPNRNYTVWVVPYGKGSQHSELPNPFDMPAPTPGKTTQAVEVWYRIYVPDQNTGDQGNVDLPTIEAFSLATGEPVSCPARKKKLVPPLLTAAGNMPPQGQNGNILFFASGARALYANQDNRYVAAHLNFSAGKVAVVRFRAPTFPDTLSGGGIFNDNTQVRYFSMCLGGITTQTSGCLADYQLKMDRDGFITVVVGPRGLRDSVEAAGLNFIPRGLLIVPVLIYRNLLTQDGFAGNFGFAPKWPPDGGGFISDPDSMAAYHYIGDYAPQGHHCSESDFSNDLNGGAGMICGVPVITLP